MRRNRLGKNGPEISVVGYGAWEAGGTDWGPNESDESVIDAIRAGLGAGIDWVDTAEVYGDGVSERLVGKAIAGRRDEVTIATKVAPKTDGTGFRPDEVARACDASMQRLGIDHIDLYQLHWPDPDVPVEETWGAMAGLQDAGKVRWIGVSNFDRADIERCLAERHVDSLQPEFSLLARENADLIRWCGETGIGVISYGPLAFGLLTGRYTKADVGSLGDWRDDDEGLFAHDRIGRNLEIVDGVRAIGERLGATPGQVALAWNVAQPGVTAAIAGSRNAGHVRQNAAAGDLVLDAATLAEIDGLIG